MAIPSFNPEHHHVGIGPVGESLYGFLLAGAYARGGQNYGSPTDFGGQRDLIGTPGLSRWTMDDFSGGAFSYRVGKDPAMFAGSQNCIPSQTDKTIRTVPPLAKYIGENTGGLQPIYVFQNAGTYFAVFQQDTHGIIRWNLNSKARNQHSLLVSYARFNPNDKILYTMWSDGSIVRLGVPDTTSGGYASWVKPTKVKGVPTGLELGRSQIIAAYSNVVWSVAIPDGADASTTLQDTDWVRIGRLPGQWKDAVSLNGLTYILCAGANLATSLVAYDGNAVQDSLLPVSDFPYSFQGKCLCAYGGRLYVGGSAQDVTGSDRYAMLFEVTGNSLREVRMFAPESRAASSTSKPKAIRHMAVHEGLLWFGDDGNGLVAYDITTDAFYGASLLPSPDGVTQATSLLSTHDDLYCWLRTPGVPSRDGLHRIARLSENVQSYRGRLFTSDFDAEPDRRKRWSQLKILTRYGPAEAAYSLSGGSPGGDSFTPLSVTSEVNGDMYLTTVDMSAVPASHQIRLRIDLPRGRDVPFFTELLAFTLGFLFLDTGKWAWTFTVNGTERVQRPDGSTEIVQVHDVGSELRRYWRDRLPLRFRDLDGQTYNANLTNFSENQPVVGEGVGYVDRSTHETKTAQEAFYTITLVEV